MSDLKICRICLCKDAKLFDSNRYHLKQYYEQIMTMKISDSDGLPHHFCHMCATMLYKFQKFKEKCHTGQKILQELQWAGPITSISISQIDRQGNNLISPINIITISKRVKTLCIKNKLYSQTLDEIKKKKETKGIKVDDTDSDNSSDDKNLAEIKKENKDKKDIGDEQKKDDAPNISAEEKPLIDFEDDRQYSDEDDEEKINVKIEVVEDLKIEQEKDNQKTVKIIENVEKPTPDNYKKRRLTKSKSKKEPVAKKSKKFEVGTKRNYLDPQHWLKINLNEEEAFEEFQARAKDSKYIKAAYKCTSCFRGFSKEEMLTRHMKLRHSESLGPVECRFCKMRFKWKCYLTRHIPQHYTKYKCLRCEQMCPLECTAVFHNEFHNGVRRKCKFCGEEFRHLSSYYTHLRLHRSEHVCTLCGASFVSAMGLRQHKRNMHVDTVINTDEERMYCDKCDIRFETRMAYEQHFTHSAKHGFEDSNETTSAEPKRFDTKGGTDTFKRNPRKSTPCTICHKNFPSHTAYLKHHKAEHTSVPLSKLEERQICEICGASLAPGSVASHLNSHTRKKLYTCPTCGHQFYTKGSMERHQLVHSGEKPFECSLCDKRFTQQGSAKLHYRTVHLKEPHPKRNRRKKSSNLEPDLELFKEDPEENLKVHRWS